MLSTTGFARSVGKIWQLGVLKKVNQTIPFLPPKLANYLHHLVSVGLAWHTTGIYHSVISSFLGTQSSQGFKSSYHL